MLGATVWFLNDLNVFDSLLGLVNEPILEEIIFKISSRTSIFFKLFLLTKSLIYVSLNRLFKYNIYCSSVLHINKYGIPPNIEYSFHASSYSN